jgi:hypothetical protein
MHIQVALSHTPKIELEEFWSLFRNDSTPDSSAIPPDVLQTAGHDMHTNPMQTGNPSDEKQKQPPLSKPETQRVKAKSKGDWAVAGEPHDSWEAFQEGNMNSDFGHENPLRIQPPALAAADPHGPLAELPKGPVRAHMGASAEV